MSANYTFQSRKEIETDKEFIRFLTISKASASEVQSQLYDQNYIDKKDFDELYEMLNHCSRQIANFKSYLKGARKIVPKDTKRQR